MYSVEISKCGKRVAHGPCVISSRRAFFSFSFLCDTLRSRPGSRGQGAGVTAAGARFGPLAAVIDLERFRLRCLSGSCVFFWCCDGTSWIKKVHPRSMSVMLYARCLLPRAGTGTQVPVPARAQAQATKRRVAASTASLSPARCAAQPAASGSRSTQGRYTRRAARHATRARPHRPERRSSSRTVDCR